jgi:ketosteroid isomerase-like protein
MTIPSPAVDKAGVVAEFLTKIGKLDIDGAAEHLDENAVMCLPYLDQIEDVRGRDAIVERIKATVPAMLTEMVFTFDAWYETAQPDVVIVEYRSKCPWRGRDGFYENTYIGIYGFNGQKIILYKEYLNPLKLDLG